MSNSGRTTQNYLIQELGSFKQVSDFLEYTKSDLYRVLDCGEGYWFFGYLDVSLIGQGDVQIKTSFVDSLYQAITSLDPSTFSKQQSLLKYFEYKKQYTEYAVEYLKSVDKDNLPTFLHEPESELLFKNYLKDQTVKIDTDEFQLSM